MWIFGLIDQRVMLNCSHMLEVPILSESPSTGICECESIFNGCTDMAEDEPSFLHVPKLPLHL